MPTTNPVPSTDPSDLLFNAGKLDEVVNGTANSFTDRLGVARRTVAGMNADFDAQLADAKSNLNIYRADAAASAAEALGYLQTIRATSYGAYASDPATDPLGNPPTVGDEYFNTTANLLKRWNGTTWQASDINTANLAASSGSSLVGYDGGTVQDVLDGAKSLQDYAALRAYSGRATSVSVTTRGIYGHFQRLAVGDPEYSSLDNGGIIIVDSAGRRWKRQYGSVVLASWFEFAANGTFEQAKFQTMLDAVKTGDTIDLCGLTITLAKGAARADYPSNDQPCVVLKSKVGITIDNGTLKVNHHGLGAIDFNSTYGCSIGPNCHIEGPGLDKIPPLDGITGRAEKGYTDGGYYNAALYNSSPKYNNSFDTSGYSTGGYGGNFPQWGGGTASTWGVWNGGYIFNFGNGLTIIDSDKVSFSGEAHGFNGSGVFVKSGGHIRIENKAKLHHNYNSGISVYSSLVIKSVTVDDVDCYENGHPNADGKIHQNVDPGYGFAMGTGSSAAEVVYVTNSRFVNNRRKGVDSHGYKSLFVTNNYIDNSHWGIALVPPTGSSSERAVIHGNTVRNIYPTLLIRGFAIAAHGFVDLAAKSVTITANTIEEIGCLPTEDTSKYSSGGLAFGISALGTEMITITGNTVQNKTRLGDGGIYAPYTAIASGLLTITGNTVDGKFRLQGISAGNAVRRGLIEGNVVDISDTGIAGAAPVCVFILGSNTSCGINTMSNYRQASGALSNVALKYQIYFHLDISAGTATIPTGFSTPEYPGTFSLTKSGNDFSISWLTQALPRKMSIQSSLNQNPLKTISDNSVVDLVSFGSSGNTIYFRFIKTVGGVTSYVPASDVTGSCAVLLEY